MALNRTARGFLLILGIVSVLAAATAGSATLIPLTSAEGWPNGRVSNDTPPNAIDGDINTFTWTTESGNVAAPSNLGVGFDSTLVNRIRLWKTPNGGGGQNIKDLVIQYTTDTSTPLDTRNWQTVSGLLGDYLGTEVFHATSVNANGTVTGDVHDSPGDFGTADGWGSLLFDPVVATGLRISFSNPSNGFVNHYRVGEFEALLTPVPEPSTLALAALGLASLGWIARHRPRTRG